MSLPEGQGGEGDLRGGIPDRIGAVCGGGAGAMGEEVEALRVIGILGGMSAASTQTYYRLLCEMTRDRLGPMHSPELLIRSLDFAPIAAAHGGRLGRA